MIKQKTKYTIQHDYRQMFGELLFSKLLEKNEQNSINKLIDEQENNIPNNN